MLDARFKNGGEFKKLIESIKDLVKNVNIDATSTGLSMQAMDSSHVALVYLQYKENGFENFRCDQNFTLGIQIENLSKVLKCSGAADTVTIRSEEENAMTLKFIFESKNGELVSEFNMNLMNLDSQTLSLPETSYSSIITLDSSEFTKICKDLSNLDETIHIETDKSSINFSVNGSIGNGSMKYKECDKVSLQVDEPVSLSFSIRYLNLFNKAATLSEQVILSMSPDTPLVVEYKLGGKDEDWGSIKFFLAPKINQDEGN